MRKWWFLLMIFLCISVLKSGQAIALTKAIGEPSFSIVTKNIEIKNASNRGLKTSSVLPIKYVGEFFVQKEVRPVVQRNAWKPEPIMKVPTSFQIKEKEKPIKKEIIPTPKPTPKPIVYLTFDDGPNQEVGKILDVLKAKKAKGTFFMIEPQMKRYKEAVKRIVKEGHYPALHSVTHNKNKLYNGNPSNVAKEMEQTRKTLFDITGVDSKLTRAPYGSKPYMKDANRNVLVQHGMKMWDWNVDTMDWKYQSTNPHQIVVNAISGIEKVKNKKGPIVILMHVTKGTASVLPQIIDYLYSKGYQCPAYEPDINVTMNFWNDARL